MGHYKNSHDTRVEVRGEEVRWVDYGQVRDLDPEDAKWFGEQLIIAATQAEANAVVDSE